MSDVPVIEISRYVHHERLVYWGSRPYGAGQSRGGFLGMIN